MKLRDVNAARQEVCDLLDSQPQVAPLPSVRLTRALKAALSDASPSTCERVRDCLTTATFEDKLKDPLAELSSEHRSIIAPFEVKIWKGYIEYVLPRNVSYPEAIRRVLSITPLLDNKYPIVNKDLLKFVQKKFPDPFPAAHRHSIIGVVEGTTSLPRKSQTRSQECVMAERGLRFPSVAEAALAFTLYYAVTQQDLYLGMDVSVAALPHYPRMGIAFGPRGLVILSRGYEELTNSYYLGATGARDK